MLTVSPDRVVIESQFRAGELRCPGGGGAVGQRAGCGRCARGVGGSGCVRGGAAAGRAG